MISHPSYKELLSKRKGISDTAIIVSTGPSLTKQLPCFLYISPKKNQNMHSFILHVELQCATYFSNSY
ncbi:hypothetical protein C7G83_20710, partial [Siccibacter turicensis]